MMVVEVRVDNRLRLRVEGVPDAVVQLLQQAFEHKNPKYHKTRAMGFHAPKGEPPVIRTWGEDEGWLSLPRGGAKRLREILQGAGLRYRYVDERVVGEDLIGFYTHGEPLVHRVQLRDYQEACVQAALAAQNCLIKAPTGSGKTCVAIAIAARVGVPTLVVVHSGALFKQWLQRLEGELGLAPREVGAIRGSTMRLRAVTVAMQQTLNKLPEQAWGVVEGAFGCVVADEVHRSAARTFMATFDRIPAKYRIGISADERRTDRKEFLVYDLFGGVAMQVHEEELIAAGVIHDVGLRLVGTQFEAPWYAAAKAEGLLFDFNRYLDEATTDEGRNEVVVGLVRDRLAAGKRLMVFSHRREHAIMLDAAFVAHGYRSSLLLGGAGSSAQFEEASRRVAAGELDVVVGTIQAMGEGLDFPRVDEGVLCTPISSKQQFGQLRGRICRATEGKTGAVLWCVWDEQLFGEETVRTLKRWGRDVRVVLGGVESTAAEWLQRRKDAKAEERKRRPWD
jgi:superfamily II DNA or RNA helicase